LEYPRRPNKLHRSRRNLSAYLGTYGNFAYGNVTILYDPEVQDNTSLILQYGLFDFELFPGNKTDHFELDIFWVIPQTVQFWSSMGNNEIDRAEIQLDPRDVPYSYTKGLKFSQAPPPNTGACPTAHPPPSRTPSPTKSGVSSVRAYQILWVFFVIYMIDYFDLYDGLF
ncbi:unnamed protein product, partial [Owenia fusiformis]